MARIAHDLRRRIAGLATVMFIAFPLLASDAMADGKPITLVVAADISTTDPYKIISPLDYTLIHNVYDALYTYDEGGELVPSLATSASVTEDGLTYTMALRPNVKWHNGNPFTAQDVRFSWQRAANPDVKNPRAGIVVNKIEDVEIVDDLTIKIHLKQRDANFLENLVGYWYISSKKYFDEAGEEGYVNKPVGTGPFRFVERREREYYKLAANDEYWGHKPKVSEVTVKTVPDDQARIAQIQTGEADIVTPVPLIFAQRMKNSPDFRIVQRPAFSNSFYVISTTGDNESLKKVEVRRALNMAVNKPEFASAIAFGFATLHDALCNPVMIGCDADIEPYPYDAQKAHQMLVDAGFDFSVPIKIVGAATGRVVQGKETTEGLAKYLEAVGIKTEIEVLEYGAWVSKAVAKPKDPTIDLFHLIVPDNNRDPGPRYQRTFKTGATFSFFSDPELDATLDKIGDFSSPQENAEHMKKVVGALHEKAVAIPLWSFDALYAVRNDVEWSPTPSVLWPILWTVEKK